MPINVTNNEISAGIEQYFKDNDIDIKDIRNLKLLLQQNNDLLEGGLRSNNVMGFRNTYIINSSDSLDATYPLDVHFNIENEMTKIVSIKLSFWIMPFRAYETAAASGGGQTSSSVSTPSGGGDTSGAGTTLHGYSVIRDADDFIKYTAGAGTHAILEVASFSGLSNHTHTTPNHTHPAHTHTVADHAHAITFGIYEEDNSPTIGFQISRDNGATFGSVLGTYTNNVTSLELKDYITSSGGYIIRFTSTARARLSVQLTCKLDITAR